MNRWLRGIKIVTATAMYAGILLLCNTNNVFADTTPTPTPITPTPTPITPTPTPITPTPIPIEPTPQIPPKPSNPGNPAAEGESDLDRQKCSNPICYSPAKHGVFWIEMDADSDNISPGEIGFGYTMKSSTPIQRCLTLGGKAYVLVTRMYYYNTNIPANYIAGEVPLYTAYTSRHGFVEDNLPLNISKSARWVSEEYAHSVFNKYEKEHNANGFYYNATSSMAWFCAEADGDPPPDEDKYPDFEACNELFRGSTLRGQTTSRIAVINNTLDRDSHIQDKDAYRWETISGPREPLQTESDYGYFKRGVGGLVETLAKPGDSIQFLHCISFGVRFVKVAVTESNKNKYTTKTVHSVTPNGEGGYLKLPDQKFVIDSAGGSSYVFGNQAQLVNEKLKLVNQFDGDAINGIVSNKRDGLYADSSKALVAVLSPTPSANLNCTRYSESPYYIGSFKIPGFRDGSGCESSNVTGETSEVGHIINQNHTFRSLHLYEQNWYEGSENCSTCCENCHYAHSTSHTNGTVDDSFSEWFSGYRETPYECIKGSNCHCWTVYDSGPYLHDDGEYRPDTHEECDEKISKELNTSRYRYNHILEDFKEITENANVYVPYNYETAVNSALVDVGEVIYQGTQVTSNFTWSIVPRMNDKTSNGGYATHTTDNTIVRMVEFITDDRMVEGDNASTSDPCAYYGGDCVTLKEYVGVQNAAGRLEGSTTDETRDRFVPDDGDYVGKKYCVAIGIWPADSHDYAENTLDAQKRTGTGEGTALDGGYLYWNISNASCRTIAKKPNFQVWNGSTYTDNSIVTSLTEKYPGVSRQDYVSGFNKVFGSWDEYAIIAGKGVYGMASGAKIGYEDMSYNFGLSGGMPIGGNSYNYLDLSPMTVNNDKLPVGNSNISAQTSISLNLERLKARYKEKAESYGEMSKVDKSIYTSPTGLQYINFEGDLKVSEIKKDITKNSGLELSKLAMNTLTTSGSGIYKNYCNLSANKKCDSVDNTLVINVKGTLTVDKNICYTDSVGKGCGDDSTMLISYSSIKTKTPATIPQIVIFADRINVTKDVNRVDAWLVSDTIDTCSNFVEGSGSNKGSNHKLCGTTLVINGPVFSRKIYLHRTAGANYGNGVMNSEDLLYRTLGSPDSGSIAPAEIFNLRADVYLWAYNQAQRYSEAVVTYTRELAPRY